MNTTLSIYEPKSLKVGKKQVVRIALYSRLLGSNLNLVADDGSVSTWLLADAPDAVRKYLAKAEPTESRSL